MLDITGMTSGLAFLSLILLRALAKSDDPYEVSDLLLLAVGREHRRTLGGALASDFTAALRELDRNAPLREACQALLDYLADEPASRDALEVQMRLDVSDRSLAQDVRQIVVHGNYVEAPHNLIRERQEHALLDYLRSLRTEYSSLQLSQIDAAEGRYQRPMRLERVYIGLNTERQTEMTEGQQGEIGESSGQPSLVPEMRHLTALEALIEAQPPRLLLLGAPGIGKSTFVNHLVLCLAGAALTERQSNEPQPNGRWLTRLPGWSLGALLPIPVVLRDFAPFVPLAEAKKGSLALLHRFLAASLGAHTDALDLLTEALTEGQAMLLFDGLDEVTGDVVLARVGESILAAAGAYTRAPVLVTCRTLDYQTNPRRQLRGFRVETLAPFDAEQIAAFVDAWYDELAATGRRMLGNAAALRKAIQERSELHDLARLPLLLTMMAVVHAGRGTLPDARAMLYAECIELLLLRWRQEPGNQDLLAKLQLPQFGDAELLRVMARLGFIAHEVAARDPTHSAEPADLSQSQVQEVLAQAFAPYVPDDPLRRDHLVSVVIYAIATRNGLLLKRGAEGREAYAFPHRSFQEFLAGSYLSSQSDYDRLCLQRAALIHWHEVLRLMVSYQVLAKDDRGRPLALARDLLDRSPLEQTLAGELLAIIGRERAVDYRREVIAPGGLWVRAQQSLMKLALSGRVPDAPAPLRVRAGLAAGTLMYGSIAMLGQPKAAIPFTDPRLPFAARRVQIDQPWWQAALRHYWCPIQPGSFWYGDDNEKKPLQRMELPYGFKIARYPVTNADYARFIADDGYNPNQPWWTEQGRAFLLPGGHRYDDQRQPITLPRAWQDPEHNNPAQPVVAVSWYEAAAYAGWLTERGHRAGWLPATDIIRLPTGLEWERAARHTDQWRYPWGDSAPDIERANYEASNLNQPSPVGCYPAGHAMCGALDMAGNVDEWMATLDEQHEQMLPQKDFTDDKLIVVRGGTYSDGIEYLCCGARYRHYPDDWYHHLGFRLVWGKVPI